MRPNGVLIVLTFYALGAPWVNGLPSLWAAETEARSPYFRIQVVDKETGRGIPLVELETVNHMLYVTDSAGLAAVREPGLMGKTVFFHIRSYGYEYPKDGFGQRGFRAVLRPGGSKTVAMTRINVAERLYRVTGEGIYRDSVLLGEKPPIRRPLLNGGVLGQDSVINAVYRGRLYWFWGDTNRAGYPLGNFEVAGAVSKLPQNGGLNPASGVDLNYFVGEEGFTRPMCPIKGPGPVWIDALMAVSENGEERLVAHYKRMKNLGERHEHGIAVWDDRKEVFQKRAQWPLDVPASPFRNPVKVNVAGQLWFYFPNPYPVVRVRARFEDILDPSRYEAFTPLKPGTRNDKEPKNLERDAAGHAVWAWKPNTSPVRHYKPLPQEEDPREAAIDATGPEGLFFLRDVKTGKPIRGHGGSVHYNSYRHKWVMIALESLGRSLLGEVWYAEADTPLGPWVYARRIVTHEKYSFYNVKHHPYFDQEGGRHIYFEGTYTKFLTDSPPTPRYDYNQIMYRLDLSDQRLFLPHPVYETESEDGGVRYGMQRGLETAPPENAVVRFYALPPDRPAKDSLPVDAVSRKHRQVPVVPLRVGEPGAASGNRTVFRALPSRPARGEQQLDDDPLVPLYEYEHRERGQRIYAPPEFAPDGDWNRGKSPLCSVWRSPRLDPPRETGSRPTNHRAETR